MTNTIRMSDADYAKHQARVKGVITEVVAGLKAPAKPARKKLPTLREKGVPREFDDQCAVVAWWQASCASYGLDSRLLVASVNGSMLAGDARLRSIQAMRLKKSGMVAGEPDLSLRVARAVYHGLYLELKRVGWKPPKSGGEAFQHWQRQLEVHELLRRQGYRVLTCHGAESAIAAINDYLRSGSFSEVKVAA